ncbi:MAG: hypothetical protein LBF24_04085 [Puniceicoccales bacterium]|nr:hypothetical protein [Puniceicoccales bacterium]
MWVQRKGSNEPEGPYGIDAVTERFPFLIEKENFPAWATIVCLLVFHGSFMPFVQNESIRSFRDQEKGKISDETLAKICLPYPFTENGVGKFVFFATAVILGGRLYAITGPLPHDPDVAYNALLIENWHGSPPPEEDVADKLPSKTEGAPANSRKAPKTPRADSTRGTATPAANGKCDVA